MNQSMTLRFKHHILSSLLILLCVLQPTLLHPISGLHKTAYQIYKNRGELKFGFWWGNLKDEEKTITKTEIQHRFRHNKDGEYIPYPAGKETTAETIIIKKDDYRTAIYLHRQYLEGKALKQTTRKAGKIWWGRFWSMTGGGLGICTAASCNFIDLQDPLARLSVLAAGLTSLGVSCYGLRKWHKGHHYEDRLARRRELNNNVINKIEHIDGTAR